MKVFKKHFVGFDSPRPFGAPLHYGMIATGNHGRFNSLRDAPPS